MPRSTLLKYIDHITFPRVIGELVRNHPDLGAQGRGVVYTAAYPKVKGQIPAIVYRLIRRTPGMQAVETRKPRLRASYPNEDGSVTEVWSQWMTCLFQFDVCAETADEAEDLLYKFDHLVRDNVGLFLSLGASEVVFEEQLIDQLLPSTMDVVTRSIRWLARLESIEYRTVSTIDQIRIRTFYPQEETYEEVVRQPTIDDLDILPQTYVSRVLCVAGTDSPSGIARTPDYIEDLDYEVVFQHQTAQVALRWLEPGRRPAPGTSYYVRYLHWTAFSTLYLPAGPP
jgi:hypothetical protein